MAQQQETNALNELTVARDYPNRSLQRIDQIVIHLQFLNQSACNTTQLKHRIDVIGQMRMAGGGDPQ